MANGEGGVLLTLQEEALVASGRAAKMDSKPSVMAAKARLREAGPAGASLATRLDRLGKARNAAGHPEAAVAADVGVVLEAERRETVTVTDTVPLTQCGPCGGLGEIAPWRAGEPSPS